MYSVKFRLVRQLHARITCIHDTMSLHRWHQIVHDAGLSRLYTLKQFIHMALKTGDTDGDG